MHHRNAKGIIALARTFARPRHAVMGLPFLLLGLINLLMPLWVYRKGLGTAYAATTERVIIISGNTSKSVRSLGPADIYDVALARRTVSTVIHVLLDGFIGSRKTC